MQPYLTAFYNYCGSTSMLLPNAQRNRPYCALDKNAQRNRPYCALDGRKRIVRDRQRDITIVKKKLGL